MVKSDPEAGNWRGWGDLSGELTSPSKTPRKKRKSVKARGKEETKRVDDGLWGFVFLFFWLSLFFFLLFPDLCSLFLARSLSLSLSFSLSLSPFAPRSKESQPSERKKKFRAGEGKEETLPPFFSLDPPLCLSLRGCFQVFPLIYKRQGPFSLSSCAAPFALAARAHKQSNALIKAKQKTAAKVRVVMSSIFIVPKVFSRIFSLSSFSPFPVPALASPHTAAPLACLSLDPPLLDEDDKPDAAGGGGGHWGLDAPPFPPPNPKCCCCW